MLFSECLESQKYTDVVMENDQLARAIGLESTPTFILVMEGKEPLGIVGAQPYSVFQEATPSWKNHRDPHRSTKQL
jgi:predicted DsbA family dithiol-disulfide isomerase